MLQFDAMLQHFSQAKQQKLNKFTLKHNKQAQQQKQIKQEIAHIHQEIDQLIQDNQHALRENPTTHLVQDLLDQLDSINHSIQQIRLNLLMPY